MLLKDLIKVERGDLYGCTGNINLVWYLRKLFTFEFLVLNVLRVCLVLAEVVKGKCNLLGLFEI